MIFSIWDFGVFALLGFELSNLIVEGTCMKVDPATGTE